MKTGKIEFRYFEKGDYVRTTNGVARVTKNEKEIKTENDLLTSLIHFKPKKSNCIYSLPRKYFIRIESAEYNDNE